MIKKIICIIIVLIVIACTVFQSVVINKFNDLSQKLEINYIGEDGENKLTVGELDVLKNKYILSCQSEKIIKILDTQVKVLAVDDNFIKFATFNITEGKWFDDFNINENICSIVVSNSFAKLIGEKLDTKSVIEKEVEIEGHKYKIIGIAEQNYMLHDNDNFENEFIIYVPKKYIESDTVDKLYVGSLNEMEGTDFFADAFKQEFLQIVNSNVYRNYYIEDFADKEVLINQFKKIYYFFVEILFFIVICMSIKYLIYRAIKCYKVMSIDMYFKDIMVEKSSEILLSSIFISLMSICGIYLMMRIVDFNIYISNDWIPQNYIFDISFYKDVYKSKHIMWQYLSDYGKTYRDTFYVSAIICCAQTLLSTVCTVLICRMLSIKNINILEQEEKKKCQVL